MTLNEQGYGYVQFYLRTLSFRYILGNNHIAASDPDIEKAVMSCFYFILEVLPRSVQTNNHWETIEQLNQGINQSHISGYFESLQHLQIME